ncbi:hypothetical protein ACXZ9C_11625 [Streptococcus agalactiae]
MVASWRGVSIVMVAVAASSLVCKSSLVSQSSSIVGLVVAASRGVRRRGVVVAVARGVA